jgi:hypothetical protein
MRAAWMERFERGARPMTMAAPNERKGWSLATCKRHRDTAAGLIARRLNSAAVEIW